MPHITVVCTANICRSPVAEAILRQRLNAMALPGEWTVDSAGTWALEKREATHYSQEVAGRRGLDLTQHRARMITEEILAAADLVLCMTSNHVEALQVEFPAQRHKIHLLAAMGGKWQGVQDPYGGPLSEYEAMALEVEKLLDLGLPRIIESAQRHYQERTNASSTSN